METVLIWKFSEVKDPEIFVIFNFNKLRVDSKIEFSKVSSDLVQKVPRNL